MLRQKGSYRKDIEKQRKNRIEVCNLTKTSKS